MGICTLRPSNGNQKDRKNYPAFRKFLLRDGFNMIQFSMYARHSTSRENAEVDQKRVKNNLSALGQVIIFEITDAQFGRIEFFIGKKPKESSNQPRQLEMF